MKGSTVLAYDYPILGILWTTVIIMLWILWFVILFRVIADVFHSEDLGGWGKTLWLLFVLFLPFLGVFVYLIARGNAMTKRMLDRAAAQQGQFDDYVRSTAASTSSSTADELAKFAALRDQGVLTDAEFATRKAQLLA
jgi:Short C-terminal domain/Phospholipase_D-nuclease N-terminal